MDMQTIPDIKTLSAYIKAEKITGRGFRVVYRGTANEVEGTENLVFPTAAIARMAGLVAEVKRIHGK